jgi:hypothetical protein
MEPPTFSSSGPPDDLENESDYNFLLMSDQFNHQFEDPLSPDTLPAVPGLRNTKQEMISNIMDDSTVLKASKMKLRPSAAPAVEQFVQETITSFAPGWIEEPRTGEKFPSVEEELRRLQAYAFFSGFSLVTGSSTTDPQAFSLCQTWD